VGEVEAVEAAEAGEEGDGEESATVEE
jgi:hypothetical protein